jgi:RNA 3'-terminal phosphate cyclase
MNKKFALTLISSPALFASMMSLVMMTTQPARASQVVNKDGSVTNCLESPHAADHHLVCQRVSKTALAAARKSEVTVAQVEPNQITELKFTEEESDASIALFGCDCTVCLNALRQLRGLSAVPV